MGGVRSSLGEESGLWVESKICWVESGALWGGVRSSGGVESELCGWSQGFCWVESGLCEVESVAPSFLLEALWRGSVALAGRWLWGSEAALGAGACLLTDEHSGD